MNINRFSGSEAIGNIYESDSAYGKHFLQISIAPTTINSPFCYALVILIMIMFLCCYVVKVRHNRVAFGGMFCLCLELKLKQMYIICNSYTMVVRDYR